MRKAKSVLVVFGTRPEAIKMCPVVLELKKREDVECVVCVTGQHREMLDQVMDAFSVRPEYDLAIMQKGQTLNDITGRILTRIDSVLAEVNPDIVLVHGDTTTAYAAAVAAFYRQIPVGHVEAGLRTYNIYSPFPEEFNRQSIGLIASYHFAPTPAAKDHLLREGKPAQRIFVTGNTAIDALHTTVRPAYTHPELDWAKDGRLILITAHRRENLGEPMKHMFRAIRRVVQAHPDVKALYPIHMNPIVRETAQQELAGCDAIHIVEPMDVVDFHNLMAKSYLILTDSGGIQEEAPALGKPVLVMREQTERPEGVQAGTLELVGTDEERIFAACHRLLTDPEAYARMAHAANPYGDGQASARIAEIISGKSLE